MDPARIAELLQPFLGAADDQRLTTTALLHISTYIDILQRWNARINLTAIRDPDAIVTRHFGESLFAARHLFPSVAHVDTVAQVETAAPGCPAEPSSAGIATATAAAERRQNAAHGASRGSAAHVGQAPEGRKKMPPGQPPSGISNDQRPATNDRPAVADVGSGAGFPGLPLKLWAPHISLTLIESNHKKATFLREIARTLTLTHINIQTVRAETLTESSFDIVTLRAVERFESILPTAAALVASGGRLALLIGSTQQQPARTSLPNFTWSDPIPVPLSQSRILLIAHRKN